MYIWLPVEAVNIICDECVFCVSVILIADFESEPLQTKRSDVDTNSVNHGILLFEGPSSEEDNPLIWDPIVEACNKHVALSQVDSGRSFEILEFDVASRSREVCLKYYTF